MGDIDVGNFTTSIVGTCGTTGSGGTIDAVSVKNTGTTGYTNLQALLKVNPSGFEIEQPNPMVLGALGANATYPEDLIWDVDCTNAESESYTFWVEFYDGGSLINSLENDTMLTIPVAFMDFTPPSIMSITPAGTVATDSPQIKIVTNEEGLCKFSSQNVSFTRMENTMSKNGLVYTYNLSDLPDGPYVFYTLCQDDSGNIMNNPDTIGFVIDTEPPEVEDYVPRGTIHTDAVIINLTTSENAVCRLSENPGTTYNLMAYQMDPQPDGLIHAYNLSVSEDGEMTIYARCKDSVNNIAGEETPITFTVLSPPTAEVSVNNGDPLSTGTYTVHVETSKLMESAPKLGASLDGDLVDIPLTGDGTSWEGLLVITNEMATENRLIGSFVFEGTDIDGVEGTEVLEGNYFIVDAKPPTQIRDLRVDENEQGVILKWRYESSAEDKLHVSSEDVAEDDILYYRVYRAKTPIVTPLDYIGQTETEYFQDTGLEADETYYYSVNAIDFAGNEGRMVKGTVITYEGVAEEETSVETNSQVKKVTPKVDAKTESPLINDAIKELFEMEILANQTHQDFVDFNTEQNGALVATGILPSMEEFLGLFQQSYAELRAIDPNLDDFGIIERKNLIMSRIQDAHSKIPKEVHPLYIRDVKGTPETDQMEKGFEKILNGLRFADLGEDLLKDMKRAMVGYTNDIESKTTITQLEVGYPDDSREYIAVFNTKVHAPASDEETVYEGIMAAVYIPDKIVPNVREFVAPSPKLLFSDKDSGVMSWGLPVLSADEDINIIYYMQKHVPEEDIEDFGFFFAPEPAAFYTASKEENKENGVTTEGNSDGLGNELTGFFSFSDMFGSDGFEGTFLEDFGIIDIVLLLIIVVVIGGLLIGDDISLENAQTYVVKWLKKNDGDGDSSDTAAPQASASGEADAQQTLKTIHPQGAENVIQLDLGKGQKVAIPIKQNIGVEEFMQINEKLKSFEGQANQQQITNALNQISGGAIAQQPPLQQGYSTDGSRHELYGVISQMLNVMQHGMYGSGQSGGASNSNSSFNVAGESYQQSNMFGQAPHDSGVAEQENIFDQTMSKVLDNLDSDQHGSINLSSTQSDSVPGGHAKSGQGVGSISVTNGAQPGGLFRSPSQTPTDLSLRKGPSAEQLFSDLERKYGSQRRNLRRSMDSVQLSKTSSSGFSKKPLTAPTNDAAAAQKSATASSPTGISSKTMQALGHANDVVNKSSNTRRNSPTNDNPAQSVSKSPHMRPEIQENVASLKQLAAQKSSQSLRSMVHQKTEEKLNLVEPHKKPEASRSSLLSGMKKFSMPRPPTDDKLQRNVETDKRDSPSKASKIFSKFSTFKK